jgi:type I restriction enzyme S subunit
MFLVRENDLVINRIWAQKGSAGIVTSEISGSVVTQDFPVFALKLDQVIPEYIAWYLKTEDFRNECRKHSYGTSGRQRLSPKESSNITFPLCKLEEQKRILAKLKSLMEYVSQAHLLRKQAIEESRMMQGKIMVNVFNKLLSDGCTVMKISEVSSINMGQSPPGLSYNTLGDGVPLLNGPTEFGERYPTAIQWTTAPTKLCKEGDILICVRGATTGRMNWADREYCIGRGLAALTPRKEICNAEYVYYFVETQTQQMLALAAGSTFPNLPGAKLRKLDIPIPSLDKQHKIVEYLSTLEKRMDELGKLQQETGKEIKRLIPRVLDKAFKGNL